MGRISHRRGCYSSYPNRSRTSVVRSTSGLGNFLRLFDLTPETGMPIGSVFRAKISGVCVLCIHGIHPSPINLGTHFRQYLICRYVGPV